MKSANERTPNGPATPKPNSLRDAVVMRLKAHDAAVRSTLSDERPPAIDTKDD